MKGRRFDDIEGLQANATRQMRDVTKSDYQRCFRLWQERWNKYIQAQGHYFEGDEQLADKSTLLLTKKSVPELNDQPSYIGLLTVCVFVVAAAAAVVVVVVV